MELHPYLSFNGNAKEAIELYAKALGGVVTDIHLYSENPEMCKSLPDGWADKVMHTTMSAGSITIMASDVLVGDSGHCGVAELSYSGSPVSLSVNCHSVEELQTTFDILAAGGQITMALQDTFWGAKFGMLVDRFGIKWMFNYDYPQK